MQRNLHLAAVQIAAIKLNNAQLIRKCSAELLGTFALVFCGTGAIIINQQTNGQVSHAGIAITFGFIVMAMIYALGNISGAHLNPAVTIAFVLAKRFQLKTLLPYVTAQVAGAILASIVLKYLFPTNEKLRFHPSCWYRIAIIHT